MKQPAIARLEGGGTTDVKPSTLVKVAAAPGARVRITFEQMAPAANAKPRRGMTSR